MWKDLMGKFPTEEWVGEGGRGGIRPRLCDWIVDTEGLMTS